MNRKERIQIANKNNTNSSSCVNSCGKYSLSILLNWITTLKIMLSYSTFILFNQNAEKNICLSIHSQYDINIHIKILKTQTKNTKIETIWEKA